jgi:hypothetical protein
MIVIIEQSNKINKNSPLFDKIFWKDNYFEFAWHVNVKTTDKIEPAQ